MIGSGVAVEEAANGIAESPPGQFVGASQPVRWEFPGKEKSGCL